MCMMERIGITGIAMVSWFVHSISEWVGAPKDMGYRYDCTSAYHKKQIYHIQCMSTISIHVLSSTSSCSCPYSNQNDATGDI